MRFTYLMLMVLTLAVCAGGEASHIRVSPKAHWNIFKGHDRIPLDTHKMPSVGKLMFQIGRDGIGSCTGTLIGKRLVLTAAHCFEPIVSYNAAAKIYNAKAEAFNARLREGGGEDVEPKPLAKSRHMFFLPSFADGNLPAGAKPVPSVIDDGWMGKWSEDAAANSNDWAIVKLENAPSSRQTNDFGIVPVSESRLAEGTSLVAVGYSGDYREGNTAGVDYHCHVRKVLREGSFFHDCAIETGASGGPLLSMSVDGVTLTQDNEARFADVDPSRVKYQIVGVITAEVKRRRQGGIGGFFGHNMPFFGEIFGEPEAGDAATELEYTDSQPNIGNSSVNFANAVRSAIAEENGSHHFTSPVQPRDEEAVQPGRHRDDEGGSWGSDGEGDGREPFILQITGAKRR